MFPDKLAPTPPRQVPAHPSPWNEQALRETLASVLPGLSIEVVEELESTNSELAGRLRQAGRGLPDDLDAASGELRPQLLVAMHQTAGRGRLGRQWHSAPGESLTFSLALSLARADWSGLSLAVGLALVEALDPSGARLGLKWPNDLVLRDDDTPPGTPARKLGGILIESVAVGRGRAAVIGIGLNVGLRRIVQADYGSASLVEFWPAATPAQALAQVAAPLARALAAFERDGFAPVAEAYARRDVLRGHAVRSSDPAVPEGLAAGVDADGALRIQAGGRTQRVLSGEVSVRLAD